jgi:hypothetical protein
MLKPDYAKRDVANIPASNLSGEMIMLNQIAKQTHIQMPAGAIQTTFGCLRQFELIPTQ